MACVVFNVAAYAQSGSISGKVLDDKRIELPGSSVQVQGTTSGSAVDGSGNYKISGLPAGTYTVIAKFLGYITAQKLITVRDGQNTTADFLLQAQTQSLNEVVVVGYGTEKRKDVTGAIATVSAKDFQQGQITTPEQLIAGKVAGVSVISNSGAPGAGSTIRIRGGASINGSNDPLIVIDGVPLSNTAISGAANPLDMINPNDIESFSVLKDASAAAIYGNRASNGVILITTKKGQSGRPVVNFSTQFSISQMPKDAPVLSNSQFRAYVNAHDTTKAGKYRSLLGTSNTNWQKQIYQTAVSTDNNLSLSGSAGKLPYRVSAGYTDQNGIIKTSSLERYTASISLTPTLLQDHLKINLNLKGAMVKQRFSDGGVIGDAATFDPTQPVYAPGNKFGGYFQYLDPTSTTGLKSNTPLNPLALLNQTNDHSTVYRTIGSLALDYKLPFFPDLHANVNLGYDGSRGMGNRSVPADGANYIDVYTDSKGVNYSGYSHSYKQVNENKLFEGFLSYNKDIKAINSHVDAVAGYSIQDFKNTAFNSPSYFAGGAINPTSIPTYASDIGEYLLTSVYARVNLVIASKYILTGTIRDDYSTKFAPGQRSGVFPIAALAWRINQEDFLKDSKVLSTLKLRLGYGVTGNQDGIGNYDYLSDYSQSTSTARYQLGNNYYYQYRPSAYYPSRTWETTTTSNAAIDYGFLNDRITGSIDYYYRKTKNLLSNIGQPALSNFSNQIVGNIGNMSDKGLEFSINANIISQKEIGLTASFNITYNQNTISNLSAIKGTTSSGILTGGISGGTGNTIQVNSVGSPKNSFYAYQQIYNQNGQPIDGLFADRNHDGTINQNDLYIGKSPDPKEYLGFSTDLRVHRFSLGLVARASLGNYVYNNVASGTGVQNAILNPLGTLNNGSNTVLQSNLLGTSDKDVLSDYWIQNGSFLRLDNVHLGYNFGRITRNGGTLRLTANVQNVFIITGYKGVDPEVSNGIDNNFYPRPRTYVLGLNLSL